MPKVWQNQDLLRYCFNYFIFCWDKIIQHPHVKKESLFYSQLVEVSARSWLTLKQGGMGEEKQSMAVNLPSVFPFFPSLIPSLNSIQLQSYWLVLPIPRVDRPASKSITQTQNRAKPISGLI